MSIREGNRYRVTTVWEGVVTEVTEGSFLLTTAEGKRIRGTLGPHATFELAQPEDWPPQPGDLWLDGEGDFQFCVEHSAKRADQAFYDSQGEDRWASTVLRERGPMKLLQRKRGAQ